MTAAALTGNRCGHRRRDPRWYDPPAEREGRRLPRIVRELQKRIPVYYREPDAVPTLKRARRADDARDQRSERREACVRLLGAMAQRLDLVTLRVGRPREDGSFAGVTMETLAGEAQLCLRRAERAIADLVAAGLVTVHPIARERAAAPGEFYGVAAIRTVAAQLFGLFGLSSWLAREREKAHRRAQARPPTREQARGSLLLRAARIRLERARTPQAARAAQAEISRLQSGRGPPGARPGPRQGGEGAE